jgi:ATP synthase protein I
MGDEKRRPRMGSTGPSTGASGTVSASSFAGLGIQFVVSILFFLYLGKWIDGKLDTAPAFLIVGVFVGAAAGFYAMIRAVRSAPRPDRRDGDTREDG